MYPGKHKPIAHIHVARQECAVNQCADLFTVNFHGFMMA